MIKLENATDQSAYHIQLDFVDEAGNAATPASCSWTMRDGDGDVVNSRSDVSVSPLTSTSYISLGADDLTVRGDREQDTRVIVVSGTYVSTISGGLAPIRKACTFLIEDTE